MSTVTQKALAAASALLLGVPTAALAHTNSIGYVGDGQGGITFWYGSWHSGTTFNEGELKLEGANGNTFAPTITQFTLIEGSTPAGLIPGTNYFTSDGTQLVPYDTNVQTSYTWQGVNFTGLSAGDYTFTYVPLGDPESYCTTCYSTADWMPMDSIILSYTISLSSAILSGDANQNGIPDIQEFGTVTTPTLTNSVTSLFSQNVVTTVNHTPSEADGIQTIQRDTQVDTNSVHQTVDTYSDGTTVTVYTGSTVTTNSSDTFAGRIDQLEVIDGVNDGINGLLNHEPTVNEKRLRVFENNVFVQSYNADGYNADSNIFGGGFEYDLTKGWTAGFQYNRVNVNLRGVDSSTQQNKDHFGIFSELRGNTLTLNTNAAIANSRYNYSRNVAGVFNNEGSTTGSEWWVSNRLYWHLHKAVKPFVGYTVQNVSRNAYTETGSVQSARVVAESNQTTHVGEAGVKVETRFGGKENDLIGVSLEGGYGTDSSYGVSASVDYKEMIFIEGSHGVNNGVTNNSVAAKVKFRF